MTKSNGTIVVLVLLCLFVFLFIWFRTPVLDYILKPLADMVWIFLRFTVLRVGQYALWIIMIIAMVIAAFFAIYRTPQMPEYPDQVTNNFFKQRYEMWELNLLRESAYNKNTLKKEIIRMIVYKYAVRKRLDIDYRLFDEFKGRKIQLPAHVYDFLLREEKDPFINLSDWLYTWSGRKARDYRRNLQECLLFLEKFMELEK